MTGRLKHAQRSKRSYKKKYIPVDMFRRNSTVNTYKTFVSQAAGAESSGTKAAGLLASLIGKLTKRKRPRESHGPERED